MEAAGTRSRGVSIRARVEFLFIACSVFVFASSAAHPSAAFVLPSKARYSRILLNNGFDDDYAFTAQIAKAKALLKDAKEKLAKEAAAANGDEAAPAEPKGILPFFAKKSDEDKIKGQSESGIVADGEKMASLSEGEAWERRSLTDMFSDETGQDDESKRLANRDVAASIYNLRKKLQTEDFRRVFDSRNRRIGDID